MLARGQIGQRAMLKELKGAGNPSDDKLFAHFWRNDQKSECKAGRNQPVPNLHPPSRVIESFMQERMSLKIKSYRPTAAMRSPGVIANPRKCGQMLVHLLI